MFNKLGIQYTKEIYLLPTQTTSSPFLAGLVIVLSEILRGCTVAALLVALFCSGSDARQNLQFVIHGLTAFINEDEF